MLCPPPGLCFSSLRSCLPSCLSAGLRCCVRLPACVSLVSGLVSDLVSLGCCDRLYGWSGILWPPHRACFSPAVCCLRRWNFCNRSGGAVLLKIVEYVMFQPAKTEVFAEIDEDGSGTIDRHEQLGHFRKSHGFVTSQPLKVRLSGCSPIRFVLLLSGFGTRNKLVFCRDSHRQCWLRVSKINLDQLPIELNSEHVSSLEDVLFVNALWEVWRTVWRKKVSGNMCHGISCFHDLLGLFTCRVGRLGRTYFIVEGSKNGIGVLLIPPKISFVSPLFCNTRALVEYPGFLYFRGTLWHALMVVYGC